MGGSVDLNILVATKIMGLPDIALNENMRCPYTGGETRILIGRVWCYDCKTKHYSPYKEYVDYIEHAWDVVEKMKKNGFRLWLEITENGRYHAFFFNKPDYSTENLPEELIDEATHLEMYGEAVEDYAPLAICMAALETVRSGDKTNGKPT